MKHIGYATYARDLTTGRRVLEMKSLCGEKVAPEMTRADAKKLTIKERISGDACCRSCGARVS